MDCVFIDEDQEEDELLPDFFDPLSVQKEKSDNCMLCQSKFGFMGTYNCKRCGVAVCDPCSKSKRRLSKLDKDKLRVCDDCDTLLSNYNFQRMYMREIEDKKANLAEIQQRVEHTQEEISERTEQLSRLKTQYQQKLKEVDDKQSIRDRQINEKRKQLQELQDENKRMKERLHELDNTIDSQATELKQLKEQHAKIAAQNAEYSRDLMLKQEKLQKNEAQLKELQSEDFRQTMQPDEV